MTLRAIMIFIGILEQKIRKFPGLSILVWSCWNENNQTSQCDDRQLSLISLWQNWHLLNCAWRRRFRGFQDFLFVVLWFSFSSLAVLPGTLWHLESNGWISAIGWILLNLVRRTPAQYCPWTQKDYLKLYTIRVVFLKKLHYVLPKIEYLWNHVHACNWYLY